HFVVGDTLALFRPEQPAASFGSCNNALEGVGKVLHGHFARVATRGKDRCLVDKVGEIGAGEAWCEGGDIVHLQVWRGLHLLDVNPEDCLASPAIWPVENELTVEAPGTSESRVQNFRPVGRREQDDADPWIETVKFG